MEVRRDDGSCFQCGKRVYEMEKITADDVVYHKSCFRCYHCNRVLSVLNYSTLDGLMFCKPHFLEAFKRKGKYEAAKYSGGRPVDTSIASNGEDYGQQNGSYVDGGSSWKYYSSDLDIDDDNIVRQSQEAKEEIPSVALKDMRNIFESLSQNASAEQQHMTIQKKPSKWDKPAEQRPADISAVVVERQNMMPLDHQNNVVVKPDNGDVQPVHGSSAVYVVEEELPPPAFTRNIVAKFRELEATGSTDKTAPSAGRVTATTSRSSRNRSDNLNVRVTPQRGSPDVADGSRLGATESERRGRAEKRSEVPQRDSSSSRERSSAVVSELPQQGMARSLLARWRTIEEQASHAQEDVPRRSSSAAKRSQSTSRIEVRQRSRSSGVPSADDDTDNQALRVAEYLDVHEKRNDYNDDQHPVLMTKEVLAKFRTMEAKQQQQQVPTQRRQATDFVNEKAFKWSVKEPVPLSRGGNLIFHGNAPRRSVAEPDSLDHAAPSEDVDPREPVFQEDELPPPELTRNLLSMFRSMEDPSRAPPTPETMVRNKAASRSTAVKAPSMGSASFTEDNIDRSDGEHVVYYAPDAGEFENDPIYNADVVRESDRADFAAEMPGQGITRGLMAKFQQSTQ